MRLPTANALSVHDNVHVYAEDCIAKRGTDPATKKQVLTHCYAATGSTVGVSEFSFGLFSYFSSPAGIYRRAFVSRVRLYQVYIFSCILRTQQRLLELARTWYTTRHFAFARFARTAGSLMHTRCLLYTSPSPRDKRQSRMPSSA